MTYNDIYNHLQVLCLFLFCRNMSSEHNILSSSPAIQSEASPVLSQTTQTQAQKPTVILYTNPTLFAIDLCSYLLPNITSDEPINELIKYINIYFSTSTSEYKFENDAPPHINKQKRYYIPYSVRINFDDKVCYKGDYVENINISCTALFKHLCYITAFEVTSMNPKSGVFYLRYTSSGFKVNEQKVNEKSHEPMIKALDEYLSKLVNEETILPAIDANVVLQLVSGVGVGTGGNDRDGAEDDAIDDDRSVMSGGDIRDQNTRQDNSKRLYINKTLSSFISNGLTFNNTNVKIKPRENTTNVVQMTRLKYLNGIPVIGYFVYKNKRDSFGDDSSNKKPLKLEHNINAEDHLALYVQCKHCGMKQVVDYYDFDNVSVSKGKVQIDCRGCYETFVA